MDNIDIGDYDEMLKEVMDIVDGLPFQLELLGEAS